MTTPAPTPPLAPWKRRLFGGILLVLLFGIGEALSIVWLKATRGYDGTHLIQYEFDAYKNIRNTPNYVDTRGIRHNSAGFRRSSEVSRARTPGSVRVFLMGASTAYGTGGLWPHLQREYEVLSNDSTIDAFLERQLRDSLGVPVEVINAGIASQWSHHELVYLNQTILGYEPDLIVFLDGYNDWYKNDPEHDQFASYAYGEQAATIMGPPTAKALVAANGWWFYRKSALGYVLSRALRTLKDIAAAATRGERRPLDVARTVANHRAVFPRNAERMVARNTLLTCTAGVEPMVAHQPMLILERDRPGMGDFEKKLFAFNVEAYADGYEPFMRQAHAWLSPRLDSVVRGKGGVFVDATGAFAGSRGHQIFTDYAHLTPQGNRELAAYLLPTVLERLRTRPCAAGH